jgi:hypothetical protein
MIDFVKERDQAFIKAVMDDDWSLVDKYCKKYEVAMPKDTITFKAGVYKAVQYCTNVPSEVKDEAMVKCLEMGFNPFVRPEGYDDETD